MNNTRQEIYDKAQAVIAELGWEWRYKAGTVRMYNYPYMISFTKARKMMTVRAYVQQDAPCYPGPRVNRAVTLPTYAAVARIVEEIRDKLIPRLKEVIEDGC